MVQKDVEQEGEMRAEIQEMKKEQASISMMDEFARYARLERKINKMTDKLKTHGERRGRLSQLTAASCIVTTHWINTTLSASCQTVSSITGTKVSTSTGVCPSKPSYLILVSFSCLCSEIPNGATGQNEMGREHCLLYFAGSYNSSLSFT